MCSSKRAFTRIELLAVLSALILVGLTAGRLFAASGPDSKRALCYNNLRQIGHGLQVWGDEHEDMVPWTTFVSSGGTRPEAGYKIGVAWVEFLSLSNELSSPRLLACPADASAKVASTWTTQPGGFANSGYRANALSYFVAYHVYPASPRDVITGDRDFRPSDSTPTSCGRGVVNTVSVEIGDPKVAWTNALHLASGDLLLSDGSVEVTTQERLTNSLAASEMQTDNSRAHFLNPR
jgi:hypothetical protein